MTKPRVLVAFATTEGQTEKIAHRIAEVLRGDDTLSVEVYAVDSAPAPKLYDGVIVGGSIHAGRYGAALYDYVRAYADALNSTPSAFFQVSLTSANPDEEHTAAAHRMVQELLDKTGFDPDLVAMFAGAVAYTKYGWIKHHIMRTIVAAEGGDTDDSHDHEYTDWDAVEHFARDVEFLVGGASPAQHPRAGAWWT